MGEKEKDKRDSSRGRRGKKERSRSRRSRSRDRGRRASRSRSKGRKEEKAAASRRRSRSRTRSRSRDRAKNRHGKWDSLEQDTGFEPRPRETSARAGGLTSAPSPTVTAPAGILAVPSAIPAAPPRIGTRIQSLEEIMEQVRSGAAPFQMPVLAGSALRGGVGGGLRLPARPLHEMYRPSWQQRNEAVTVAPEEVLREARMKAKQVEDHGMDLYRKTGQVPRGPPAPPTGTLVIEQKFVDFVVGPGGQSLAALNYAAAVVVHLDQTAKYAGYSVAHIYGPEDCVRRAKLALEFKISQWLPRGVSYASAPPSTFSTGDVPAWTSKPSPPPVFEKAQETPVTAGIL